MVCREPGCSESCLHSANQGRVHQGNTSRCADAASFDMTSRRRARCEPDLKSAFLIHVLRMGDFCTSLKNISDPQSVGSKPLKLTFVAISTAAQFGLWGTDCTYLMTKSSRAKQLCRPDASICISGRVLFTRAASRVSRNGLTSPQLQHTGEVT